MYIIGNSGSMNFPMTYDYGHDSSYTIDIPGNKRKWCISKSQLFWCVIGILSLIIAGLVIAVAVIGSHLRDEHLIAQRKERCDTTDCVLTASAILKSLDLSVDPCEDFYNFACGGWVRDNPVPVTASVWGQFEMLREKLTKEIYDILEKELPKDTEDIHYPPGSFVLAQEFYDTCITQDNTEEDNLDLLSVLATYLGNTHNDVSSYDNFTNVLASIRRELGGNYFFSLSLELDDKNTERHVVYLDQPQLALGQLNLLRLEMEPVRRFYKIFIQKVWKHLFPQDETIVGDIVDKIVKIEIDLAEISTPPEDRTNKSLLYNKVTLAELQQLTSNLLIDWEQYFQEVFKNTKVLTLNDTNLNTSSTFDSELDNVDYDDSDYEDISLDLENMTFIVRDVEFFKKLGTKFDIRYHFRDLINFLKWRIIYNFGGESNSQMRDMFFEFFKIISGVQLPSPRWKKCTRLTNELFGMAVSYQYIQRHFTWDQIQNANTLVADVRRAFQEIMHSKDLDWLDPITRKVAIGKLNQMKTFIGFPEWFNDRNLLNQYYRGLDFLHSTHSHFNNFIKIIGWHVQKSLNRIGKPPDPDEWITDPTTVNAFYSFRHNSINFPAALLQPPFFRMPIQALNYGAIGSIIGHEITHAFDNSGSQYDASGNLNNWWRESTMENYMNRSTCFVNQYSNFSVDINEKIENLNGINTLNENIADGGLRQSYEAYKLLLSRIGRDREPRIPGINYSLEQLFFISYAQIWCASHTSSGLMQQIMSGSHTPNEFRVKGTLQNFNEFREVWNCPNKGTNKSSTEELHKPCRLW